MLQVHDKSAFHEDGTPKRRYELDQPTNARSASIKVVIGTVVASLVAYTKDLLATLVTPTKRADLGDGAAAAPRGHPDMSDGIAETEAAPASPIEQDPIAATPIGTSKLAMMVSQPWNDESARGVPFKLTSANVNFPLIGVDALPRPEQPFVFAAPGAAAEGGQVSAPEARSPETKTEPQNRRPLSTGYTSLGSVILNGAIFLSLQDLLRHVVDPDGDVLQVLSLTASSGSLVQIGPGQWHFLNTYDASERVVFSYKVSDGEFEIDQVAELDFILPTINVIKGTDASETLIGTRAADLIEAKDGDDVVNSQDGHDVVYGGAGNDRLIGGDGDDALYGEDGDDIIWGGAGDDLLDGGAGADWLMGEAGDDLLIGGSGNDMLEGGSGRDVLDGGADADTLVGGADEDVILAGQGDDVVLATSGDGNDVIDGGNGIDTLDTSSVSTDVTVDLTAGTANGDDIGSDTVTNIENVTTGDGDDHVTGSDGNNVIATGAGDDVVEAGGGDDIVLATSGDGNDVIDGGDGIDTLDTSAVSTDVTIDLAAGTASGDDIGTDTVANIENVTTGDGDDQVTGSDGNNVIATGAGDDVVDAGGGDDVVLATVGDGNDVIDGGYGVDTLDTSAISTDVTVDLTAGTANGDDIGSDTVANIENVTTGDGDDRVRGNDQSNLIAAGAGANDVDAGGGDDTVLADLDAAKDSLDGGDGVDTLSFASQESGVVVDLCSGVVSDGANVDDVKNFEVIIGSSHDDVFIADNTATTFIGGAGDDVFRFESSSGTGNGCGNRDRILDFAVGDRIDIDALLDEIQDLVEQGTGDVEMRRFRLIDSLEEFSRPGELRLRYDSFGDDETRLVLDGNLDTESDTEFQIEFVGAEDAIRSFVEEYRDRVD